MTRDLAAEGWTRRSVASEPRLGEVADLYRSLGFEVLLVPVAEVDDEGACAVCFGPDADRHRVIYTRPASQAP